MAAAGLLAGCPGPTTGGASANTAGNPAPTPTPAPWKRATAAAAFGAISSHTSLAFAPAGQTERLWLIGGINVTLQDKVWSSTDGMAWTEETKNTPADRRFSPRRDHSSVVFKDKMWVIGGNDGSDKNDVWSSADGKTWTQVTAAANFSARANHSSLVFSPAGGTEKMWVLGGSDASLWSNTVYASDDGQSWTKLEPSATGRVFSARYSHGSVVFNNKMWVLGGIDSNTYNKNDVWSSADGQDWQEEPAATWSARQFHATVVFTDPADGLKKIWVLGGNDGSDKNDVWSSADGTTWSQDRPADWSPRNTHGAVVFRDTIWVIGGAGVNVRYGDVWYYSPKLPSPSPAAVANPAAAAGSAKP